MDPVVETALYWIGGNTPSAISQSAPDPRGLDDSDRHSRLRLAAG